MVLDKKEVKDSQMKRI